MGDQWGASPGLASVASVPQKFSCKIIVNFEQMHPGFPTIAKIVGQGEANVKHIREAYSCTVQLRGRGSGFMEPDTGQELQERMFLELSATNRENWRNASDMAQDL